MIAVDTSALIAILRREEDWREHAIALASSPASLVSAMSLYEARIVLIRADRAAQIEELDVLVAENDVRIVAFDAAQMEAASSAYARFGRGMRHPAQLNFGDCAAYALAVTHDAPLLYKGDDFARTDLRPALG